MAWILVIQNKITLGVRKSIYECSTNVMLDFWPIRFTVESKFCFRGFLGAMDCCWMLKQWASGDFTPRSVDSPSLLPGASIRTGQRSYTPTMFLFYFFHMFSFISFSFLLDFLTYFHFPSVALRKVLYPEFFLLATRFLYTPPPSC